MVWKDASGIQLRVYDRTPTLARSRLAASVPSLAGLVRIEAEVRPRARLRRALHQLDAEVLREDFATRVGNFDHPLVVSGPNRALADRVIGSYPYGDAERLLGSAEVILHGGRAAYPNDRVYTERLRQLHVAGVVPNEEGEVSLDVSAVLQSAVELWSKPYAHATPIELEELASNLFLSESERVIAADRGARVKEKLLALTEDPTQAARHNNPIAEPSAMSMASQHAA